MRSASLRTLIVRVALLGSFACGGGGPVVTLPPGGGGGGGGSSSVSGTITSAQSSFTDSDVNDDAPGSPTPTSNDRGSIAQPIPVPATIGGYVNLAGSGAAGHSQIAGDSSDFYRVDLSAGHVVSLFIGEDPAVADLELFLWRDAAATDLADSSEGSDSLEVVMAPASGTFYIEVRAWAGLFLNSSTYVLSVGQPLPGGASPADRLSITDEFVPGDVIVEMKSRAVRAMSEGKAVPTTETVASALSMAEAKGGAPDRAMLFSIGNAGQRSAMFRALDMESVPAGHQRAYLQASDEEQMRMDTIRAVKALRRRADVASVGLNYIRHASAVPNDEFYPLQWHYPLINLPLAWDISQGDGALVAVIDTGIIPHPDLPAAGNWVGGYDFIGDADRARDGDGRDPNPLDQGDRPGGGSSFHGTHVAGTVAAASNNGAGVAGVAWGAEIMPLRVLGVGGGTTFDIIQAVLYAARLANDALVLPPRRADVMNLSLGGGGFSQSAQNAYTAARNAGTVIVAAAGNENSAQLSYPASYAGVISVSAVDTQKNRAPYSNFGTAIDMAAPGGDLGSDRNGDGQPDGVASTAGDDRSGSVEFAFIYQNGTSMAAPHMAGVVALMFEEAPNMTPAQLDSLIATGSISEDVAGNGAAVRDDVYGYGLIDARLAVDAAAGLGGAPPTPNPTLRVNPSALNFGSVGTSFTITASNGGGGALRVFAPTDDANWLLVTPTSIDANGLGTYNVVIDRNQVGNGNYAAQIIFTSSANLVAVPVVMTKGSSLASNTGYQFLLLIDPETFETRGQVNLTPTNGQYSYRFTGVPDGTYWVIGGTDHDNDGFICHGGEACGAYPTLDQSLPLKVTRTMGGLDFSTGFVVDIAAQSEAGRAFIPEGGFERLDRRGAGAKSLGGQGE